MEEKDIETMEEKSEEANLTEGTEEEHHVDEEATEVPENESLEQNEQSEQNEPEEKLQLALENLQKEKDELYNRMLRIQAEYDNFKRRTQKEKQDARKYQAQELVTELLPALDNFERALNVETTDETASFLEGMSMIYRQLLDTLQSQGVTVIDTIGEKFDPHFHHAVMQVESEDYEADTVVEELQKGYLLKDRVIRPAMVKVSK